MERIYIVTAEAVAFCDDSTFRIRCVTKNYRKALESFKTEKNNLQKFWKELHDGSSEAAKNKGTTWHQTYKHTWSVTSEKARFCVQLQDFDLVE